MKKSEPSCNQKLFMKAEDNKVSKKHSCKVLYIKKFDVR